MFVGFAIYLIDTHTISHTHRI